MANVDFRTREGRAMKAAAEAAKASAAAGRILNEVQLESETDLRVDPVSEPVVNIPPVRNDARDSAMDEILKQRGMDVETPAPAPNPEPEPTADPVKPEPALAEPPPHNPAPAPVVAEPVKMVRVKVDGVEFEAPADEVEEMGGVRAYQTIKASENRLAKTNEALAETRRLQAQLAEMAKAQTPPPVTQTDAEFIMDKIDTIRFGTPADSAAAMQEVLTRNRPNFDQNQIVNRAVVAMQQRFAEQAFVNEFQDVVSNPLLLKLTIQLKNERLSQLKDIPDWSNFYRSIGNEIRGAIGRPSQPATSLQSAPAGSTSQPDKEARKASIVNLPTAAARAALPAETKPETREDTLNEMRKWRGLPTG